MVKFNHEVVFYNYFSSISLLLSGMMYIYNNKTWLESNDLVRSHFNKICLFVIISGITMLLFPLEIFNELSLILLVREYLIILQMLTTISSGISDKLFNNIELLLSSIHIYTIFILINYNYNYDYILQKVSVGLILKIFEGCVILLLYNSSKSLNKIVYFQIYTKHNKISQDRSEDMIILKNIQYDIKEYIDIRKKLKKCVKKAIIFYGITIVLQFSGILANTNVVSTLVNTNVVSANTNVVSTLVNTNVVSTIAGITTSITVYYTNDIIKYNVKIDNLVYK